MRTPPKDPREIKLLRLEFASELEEGVTIDSIDVQITTVGGVDPAPGNVLEGAVVIDNANLYGLQRIKAGTDACEYEIAGLATDSNGLKHLVIATVPVATQHD